MTPRCRACVVIIFVKENLMYSRHRTVIFIVPFMLLALTVSNVTAAGADDLIALAKSGVDEEVVNAYIENSAAPFNLTSADIVALKDLGVPSKLIVEAIKHNQPNDSSVEF